jgi:hypothetical protein
LSWNVAAPTVISIQVESTGTIFHQEVIFLYFQFGISKMVKIKRSINKNCWVNRKVICAVVIVAFITYLCILPTSNDISQKVTKSKATTNKKQLEIAPTTKIGGMAIEKTESNTTKIMKASLWILPPQPILDKLSIQIKELAHLNDTPSFIPHITAVGGIELSYYEDNKNAPMLLLEELKKEFHSFGTIPCNFDISRGLHTSHDENKEVIWSQACVGVVKREQRFIEAIEIAKKCLYESKYVKEDKKEYFLPTAGFNPPLAEPHLSLVYKPSIVEMMVDEEDFEFPEDFISTKIMLVKTDPPTFEGISNWEPIGSFLTT